MFYSAELYSYTEEPEFALNRDYFEEDFRSHGNVCVSVTELCVFRLPSRHVAVSQEQRGTAGTSCAPLTLLQVN